MMNTQAQIFLDVFSAARTHLTGVAWIDLPCTSPSFFRFVRCEIDKLTPGRVCDCFGETVIFEHPVDVELFKNDDSESVDQLAAFLMSKVSAPVGDAFMNCGNYLATFTALLCSFCR